jgi:hypothetical protein
MASKPTGADKTKTEAKQDRTPRKQESPPELELTTTPDQQANLPDTRKKGIPLKRLIILSAKGNTDSDIARIVGCAKQTVNERLAPHRDEIAAFRTYTEDRSVHQDFAAFQLLNSLSTEELKKATPYQRVGMYALLYDKWRLETGQSTENHAHAVDIIARLEALSDEGVEVPDDIIEAELAEDD